MRKQIRYNIPESIVTQFHCRKHVEKHDFRFSYFSKHCNFWNTIIQNLRTEILNEFNEGFGKILVKITSLTSKTTQSFLS